MTESLSNDFKNILFYVLVIHLISMDQTIFRMFNRYIKCYYIWTDIHNLPLFFQTHSQEWILKQNQRLCKLALETMSPDSWEHASITGDVPLWMTHGKETEELLWHFVFSVFFSINHCPHVQFRFTRKYACRQRWISWWSVAIKKYLCRQPHPGEKDIHLAVL